MNTSHEFHLSDLPNDPHFWIVIAFAVALFIGIKLGRQSILSALDARTASIRDKIEEAENLRTEAQELLSSYQHKYRDAMKEADEIIKDAQIHANKTREKALENLKMRISNMEEQAKKHLKEAQETAILEVKSSVADQAIAIAKESLEKQLKNDSHKDFTSTSIKKAVDFIH